MRVPIITVGREGSAHAPRIARCTRVKVVGDKRSDESRYYSFLTRLFLLAHPNCQCPNCANPADDVHHVAGRGRNYLRTATWLAICRPCHDWIHSHAEEARAAGLLRTRKARGLLVALPPPHVRHDIIPRAFSTDDLALHASTVPFEWVARDDLESAPAVKAAWPMLRPFIDELRIPPGFMVGSGALADARHLLGVKVEYPLGNVAMVFEDSGSAIRPLLASYVEEAET